MKIRLEKNECPGNWNEKTDRQFSPTSLFSIWFRKPCFFSWHVWIWFKFYWNFPWHPIGPHIEYIGKFNSINTCSVPTSSAMPWDRSAFRDETSGSGLPKSGPLHDAWANSVFPLLAYELALWTPHVCDGTMLQTQKTCQAHWIRPVETIGSIRHVEGDAGYLEAPTEGFFLHFWTAASANCTAGVIKGGGSGAICLIPVSVHPFYYSLYLKPSSIPSF